MFDSAADCTWLLGKFELFPLCLILLINGISDPLAHPLLRQAVKHKSEQYGKSGAESVTWNIHALELEWFHDGLILFILRCVIFTY